MTAHMIEILVRGSKVFPKVRSRQIFQCDGCQGCQARLGFSCATGRTNHTIFIRGISAICIPAENRIEPKLFNRFLKWAGGRFCIEVGSNS